MNKTKENIFTLLMSFVMSYGMELYNLSLLNKGLKPFLFIHVFSEVWYITIIVFVISKYFGTPIAKKMMMSLINPKESKPILITTVMALCTVCIMCPTMSLVATFLFKGANIANFIGIWGRTLMFNFIMALPFQLFVAGPLVRYTVKKIVPN